MSAKFDYPLYVRTITDTIDGIATLYPDLKYRDETESFRPKSLRVPVPKTTQRTIYQFIDQRDPVGGAEKMLVPIAAAIAQDVFKTGTDEGAATPGSLFSVDPGMPNTGPGELYEHAALIRSSSGLAFRVIFQIVVDAPGYMPPFKDANEGDLSFRLDTIFGFLPLMSRGKMIAEVMAEYKAIEETNE